MIKTEFIKPLSNPRVSPTRMGPAVCDLCGKSTSMLAIIRRREDAPPHLLLHYTYICKGCLEEGIKIINHAILEEIK